MKNLTSVFLTFIFVFCSFNGISQTQVGGAINVDATWSKSKSPYVVSSNVTLASGKQLIIEPGVKVRFAAGTKMTIKGSLIANGSATDSIAFTSISATDKGSWSGIEINGTAGSIINFDYCKLLYSTNGIKLNFSLNAVKVAIGRSSFRTNETAIGGSLGLNKTTEIKGCSFSNNTYAIVQGFKTINNCVFDKNEYGISQALYTDVSNSIFTNSSQIAVNVGYGTVEGCLVEKNTIGIQAYTGGVTVNNSSISENGVGLILEDGFDGKTPAVTNNQIYDNTTYNVKNNGTGNASLFTNCWFSSDSTTVEDKIYDGLDDPNVGLVSYSLFDDNCDAVLLKVDKAPLIISQWTKANSPYVLTEDYLVASNERLTIMPGVEVRFATGVKILVEGVLTANGTASDSITFTSNATKEKSSWNGIEISSAEGIAINFDYCKFLYASSALKETFSLSAVPVSIKHSSFRSNETALTGVLSITKNMTVENCSFNDNTYAITQGFMTVNNCLFEKNVNGLYQTLQIDVLNSVFTNNSQIALNAGNGTVEGCLIDNNNVGIKAYTNGLTVSNNSITNNNIGLILEAALDGTVPPVTNNQICDNTTYNVKNNSSTNVELFTNCFCSTDSATIERKIYDGLDDSSVGFIDYTLFDEDCFTPISKTDKLQNKVIYLSIEKETQTGSFKLYPNPTKNDLYIDHASTIKEVVIYDQTGKVMLKKLNNMENTVKVDVSRLNGGLYLVKLLTLDGKSIVKKLTIE